LHFSQNDALVVFSPSEGKKKASVPRPRQTSQIALLYPKHDSHFSGFVKYLAISTRTPLFSLPFTAAATTTVLLPLLLEQKTPIVDEAQSRVVDALTRCMRIFFFTLILFFQFASFVTNFAPRDDNVNDSDNDTIITDASVVVVELSSFFLFFFFSFAGSSRTTTTTTTERVVRERETK
jgi:hypothetical protein